MPATGAPAATPAGAPTAAAPAQRSELSGIASLLQGGRLLAIIPAAICLTLVGCIREPRQIPPESTPLRWNLSEMPTSLKRFLIVVALFSLGNSSNIFLLFRAKELGVPEAYIPLLWAIVSLIAALGATPLAALSDRIGRFPLLFGGYLAFALVYLSLGLLNDGLIALVLIFGLYGLFVAATEGVEKAMVADLAPSNKRGTAFGWFNMTVGIFLLPSSVIFGELYERLNPNTAFGFSAICALLACSLLWYWFRPTRAAGSPS
jgi:MFS family permease